jgi:hypothetical protein
MALSGEPTGGEFADRNTPRWACPIGRNGSQLESPTESPTETPPDPVGLVPSGESGSSARSTIKQFCPV